jgi:hypothetical protein
LFAQLVRAQRQLRRYGLVVVAELLAAGYSVIAALTVAAAQGRYSRKRMANIPIQAAGVCNADEEGE